MDYKSFLLRKGGSNVIDSKEQWGILAKSVPFVLVPDVKEYSKIDWPDEDGDDEYIPEDPHFKAYEMTVSFVYIGDYETANMQIKAFWDFVKQGEFELYDQYTKIGREKVRYVGYENDAFRRRTSDGDIVEFKFKFKVNNPTKDITLSL